MAEDKPANHHEYPGEKIPIGELSSITGIPVSTLRYYDEIGLLIPSEVDPFSQYRYYRTSQLYEVNFIESWKSLGFTLKEIKLMMKEGHESPPLDFYQNQIGSIQRKIDELQRKKTILQQDISVIETYCGLSVDDFGKIIVKQQPATSVLCLLERNPMEYRNYTANRNQLEDLVTKHGLRRKSGSLFSTGHPLNKNNDESFVSFRLPVETPEGNRPKELVTVPAHRAVSAFHKGSVIRIDETLDRMRAYLQDSPYEPFNIAYHIYHVHTPITLNEDLHVTEISIPLKNYVKP